MKLNVTLSNFNLDLVFGIEMSTLKRSESFV